MNPLNNCLKLSVSIFNKVNRFKVKEFIHKLRNDENCCFRNNSYAKTGKRFSVIFTNLKLIAYMRKKIILKINK